MGTPGTGTLRMGMPGTGMPRIGMPGARHPQLLLCAGLWEQLPRVGGIRLGEKGGSGSRWGCLKAVESNGTSQRAVPRTGPPSRSTGTAACPSPGAGASWQGAQQTQLRQPPRSPRLSHWPHPPAARPGQAQTLLPALAPHCRTRVQHPRLHPAPMGAGNHGNSSIAGAGQEHPCTRTTL